MDITFLGHSSFKIKTRDASVITDPYDSKNVGIKFGTQSADIVTVSHQHDDHNNISAVDDVKKVFDAPGEYEIKGVSIIGLPSFHDDKKGDERGKNTIFIFEVEGLRLVHLGDLGHELNEKTLELIGDVDILLIPIGGEYTIDSEKAAQIVRSIDPRIVIPMHYQMPGINPDNFSKLDGVEKFVTAAGLPSETIDKLSVKREMLGEDSKIVILEKR